MTPAFSKSEGKDNKDNGIETKVTLWQENR